MINKLAGESKRSDKIFWMAFAVGVFLMLVFISYYTLLCNDAAGIYAKMVQQFAKGRYTYAFLPGIPPLMPVLSGLVAKIGLGAYTAIKITSALFFLAGLFPLRAIMRRCLPEDLASWTCFIYVISFHIVKDVVMGRPFAFKMFFLLYSVYLIIRFAETCKIRHVLLLGVSLGLLALARAEGIFFLPFFALWFFILPHFKSYKKKNGLFFPSIIWRQIFGIILIFAVFTAVCLPQILYIYHDTGIPFTEKRVAESVKSKIDFVIAGMNKVKKDITDKNIVKPISIKKTKARSSIAKPAVVQSAYVIHLKQSLNNVLAGIYPFFLILIILGLIWMFKKRKYSIIDIFFASIILYNIALIYIGMKSIVEYRYISVTQPFEFGWAVLGAYFVYSWKLFPIKKWNRLMLIAFIGAVIGLLIDTTTYLRKQIINGDPSFVVGKWIGGHKNKFPSKKLMISGGVYDAGVLPVILSIYPQYSYWAKGDFLAGFGSRSYSQLLSYTQTG